MLAAVGCWGGESVRIPPVDWVEGQVGGVVWAERVWVRRSAARRVEVRVNDAIARGFMVVTALILRWFST